MSDQPAPRARLTAAMIVHEASPAALPTLESAASIADEILLVTLGTTTLDLPQLPHLRLIPTTKSDDPASARNLAMQAAEGDWILWLEAGETVAPATLNSLRDWLSSDEAAAINAAYLAWIESTPLAADEVPEQYAAPRLLPRSAGIQFTGRVQETILPSLERLGVALHRSDWRLHEPRVDATSQIARMRRQARLADLELQSSGLNPRALTASGEALAALGDTAKATQHFYQALRLADRGSVEMLVAYYGLLATFRGDANDHRQRLAVCLEALETYPLDAQLLLAMGTFLQQQNHWELASRSFRAAVEIGEVEPRAPHVKDIGAIAAISWSLALQLRGELEPALDVLRAAAEKFPHVHNLARRRLELLVQLGRDVEALALAPTVVTSGASLESLRIGLRGACLAAQGNWIAALTYLRTAFEATCRDPICLRWYAVGLLALGQRDAAREILLEWQRLAPSDAEAARYLAELDKGAAKAIPRPTKGRTVRVDSIVSPSPGRESSPSDGLLAARRQVESTEGVK